MLPDSGRFTEMAVNTVVSFFISGTDAMAGELGPLSINRVN